MKNGIHFKNSNPANALVLIEDSEENDRNSSDYFHTPDKDPASGLQEDRRTQAAIVACISVSLACAVTALAAGSYAAWLTRQRIARQALTDVKDILESCQKRMQQLEADVQRLPKY